MRHFSTYCQITSRRIVSAEHCQSFLCLLLGFVFARKNFVGKSIIFWTMIAMIMIPTHLMVILQSILFNRIGWINTYWAIVGVFFPPVSTDYSRGIRSGSLHGRRI